MPQPDAEAAAFYTGVLRALGAAGVPFLVGGAYALNGYCAIERHTKDLDIFVRRADCERACAVLSDAGYATEATHPHWLAKVQAPFAQIDLIFSSGNGICEVDDDWFRHAGEGRVLGVAVPIVPAEEMIWQKAFVMERERYDGADVAHLLHDCAGRLDWHRLLDRFGARWRVLLGHLVLFGFIYPAQRDRIPRGVMDELLGRLRRELDAPPPADPHCHGTLLSREQYLGDIAARGYADARLAPLGTMSEEDVAHWTAGIAGAR